MFNKIIDNLKNNSFFWGMKAIVYKEFIHILNDRFTLSLTLLIPAVQLIIYGYAIDMDVKNIKTAVLDFDKTNTSRVVIEKLQASKYFKVNYYPESEEELLSSVVSGKVKTGFIIPKHFQANILNSRPTQVQLLVDGSESSVAQQASNTASLILLNFNSMILTETIGFNPNLIETRSRVLFNPDLKSANFMIPGLLGVLMQIITAFITALAIVKEKEKGTLEQLMVSPVGQGGLLIGKLIPYGLIGFFQYLLITFVMVFLFKVPIHGSYFLLTILSTFFLFTSLSIGLFISTKSANLAQTTQLLQLVIIPSILLSGFIFPRDNMPPIMSFIGYFIPLTYFLDILRGIIIRGAGFNDVIHDVIPLLLYGIVIMYFAIRQFKKQIA
jgi:ABC-2 type transport system permease protein